MRGIGTDDLPGHAVETEQYISTGGENHPQAATCELRSGRSVFSGKRESSGRKSKPHKAPVWRKIVRCGKFLGLVDKTRQWGAVRGVWRSRQKAANRVRIQDACKAARWKVTGWAGGYTDKSTQDKSTQQKPPANESVIIITACLLNKKVIIITPDKSTQQVNKITFVPMNDKKVIKLTYGYWK